MKTEINVASIETLAITVQALHVNGKQMTQAVFRQLPVGWAYNSDGSLAKFEYWGIVRYAIKAKEDPAWVIYVSNRRIFRCSLFWNGPSSWSAESSLRKAKAHVVWWKDRKAAKDRGDKDFDWRPAPYADFKWTADGLAALEAEVVTMDGVLESALRAERTKVALSQLPQLFIAA